MASASEMDCGTRNRLLLDPRDKSKYVQFCLLKRAECLDDKSAL